MYIYFSFFSNGEQKKAELKEAEEEDVRLQSEGGNFGKINREMRRDK